MCRIAAPAILIQSLSSVMSLGLNAILTLWSELAVWVLGVYFKLQSFVFMPVFSVNNALISIISYNYGARDRHRVSRSIHVGFLAAVSTALLGSLLLWIFANPLLRVCFQASGEALTLGVPSLRMTTLSFPIAAVSIICSATLQSLGRNAHSLWVALLRQIILLLPIALLLVYLYPTWVFFSLFLAELFSCVVALLLYRTVYRQKILTL